MITQSGRTVHPQWDAMPSHRDYAIHLGRICRFAGALWWPVLAHSVLVAVITDKLGANGTTWAWALLHDLHEALTGDSPTPYKSDCLRMKQVALDALIREHFNLEDRAIDYDVVHAADKRAADAEVLVAGTAAMRQSWARWRGWDHLDTQDELQAGAVRGSVFCKPDATLWRGGDGVVLFEHWLNEIEAGRVDETCEAIMQTLKLILPQPH